MVDTQRNIFRTPFYEISVAFPDGSNQILLPQQIAKLIDRVEIVESFSNQECFHSDVIKLVFVEGSREPFAADSISDTRSLYSTENESGAFTNQAGFITDLIFSKGGGGITSLLTKPNVANLVDAKILKENLASNPAANAEAADLIRKTDDQVFIDIQQEEIAKTSPNYIFQEGNLITIKFGYVQDPDALTSNEIDSDNQLFSRTIVSRIDIVQTDFPESGQPTTTITAHGPTVDLHKISPSIGVSFYKEKFWGLSEKGAKITIQEDMTPTEIVQAISDQAGFDDPAVSDNFDVETEVSGRGKIWPSSDTAHNYLTALAKKYRANYTVYFNPITNNPKIAFISQLDFLKETELAKNELDYFIWKGELSIIKSMNILANYASPVGFGMNTVTEDAQVKVLGDKIGTGNLPKTKGPSGEANAPSTQPEDRDTKVAEFAGSLPNKKAIYKNINDPSAQNSDNALKLSANKAACHLEKIISLELNALGFPKLKPGLTFKLQNVGIRLSGVMFSIRSVTHAFDSSGYISKVMATGYGTFDGHPVTFKNAPVFKDPEQESVHEFNIPGASSPRPIDTLRKDKS